MLLQYHAFSTIQFVFFKIHIEFNFYTRFPLYIHRRHHYDTNYFICRATPSFFGYMLMNAASLRFSSFPYQPVVHFAFSPRSASALLPPPPSSSLTLSAHFQKRPRHLRPLQCPNRLGVFLPVHDLRRTPFPFL